MQPTRSATAATALPLCAMEVAYLDIVQIVKDDQ